ncbi:MAG: hypothetical protein AB7N65_01690 [Vicinamibacterales bacterium]
MCTSKLPLAISTALVTLCTATAADAWTFDYRFVERVGTTDNPIPGHIYNGTPGVPVRLRVQFAIFDDGAGPAPAGGFIAWTNGTISDSIAAHNDRTPGRLSPFNSNGGPINDGVPLLDPFQSLSQINAVHGVQFPLWHNDPNGVPLPPPDPVIRGRNAFVSVFELTTTPGLSNYTITVGGDLIAASSWNAVNSVPPNDNGTPLNPADDIPGWVEYHADPLPPQSFLLPPLVLTIEVPTPTTALAFAGAAAIPLSVRRRRS